MGETYKLQIPRDDLHDQLGQGLPAGTITLVEGAHGTGKSALVQRMIYGFLSNQHSVTCISTELTVRDFINQMYSLDYPISSWLLNGKLKFVPVYPLVGKARKRSDFLGMLMGSEELYKSDISMGDGMGLLRGDVRKLKAPRVPHMGWNEVLFRDDPLFDGVPQGSRFYFANSYVCHPMEKVGIAETLYGEPFVSAVRKGRVCGFQFHPEKSGTIGLRLLTNFVNMAEG